MRKQEKLFRKQYRSLLATYTDDSTVLHDGEEIKEKNDQDMRKSMLLTL